MLESFLTLNDPHLVICQLEKNNFPQLKILKIRYKNKITLKCKKLSSNSELPIYFRLLDKRNFKTNITGDKERYFITVKNQ